MFDIETFGHSIFQLLIWNILTVRSATAFKKDSSTVFAVVFMRKIVVAWLQLVSREFYSLVFVLYFAAYRVCFAADRMCCAAGRMCCAANRIFCDADGLLFCAADQLSLCCVVNQVSCVAILIACALTVFGV